MAVRERYLFGSWMPDRAWHWSNEEGLQDIWNLLPIAGGSYRSTPALGGISGASSGLKYTSALYYAHTGAFATEGLYQLGETAAGDFPSGSRFIQRLPPPSPAGGGASFVDVTPATLVAAPGGGVKQQWASFTCYGDKVVWADGFNPVRVYNGAGVFTDMITSPATDKPNGYFVTVVGSHVMLGFCTNPADVLGGIKLWWSARNDETEWTPGNGRAGFLYLRTADMGAITGLVGFPEYCIVFLHRGIIRLDRVSGATVFDQVVIGGPAEGTHESSSIVRYGDEIYYRSNTGFRRLVDGSRPELIGVGAVHRHLAYEQSWNEQYRMSPAPPYAGECHCVGAVDESWGTIVWMLGFRTFEQPDEIWDYRELIGYHVAEDRWTRLPALRQNRLSAIASMPQLRGASNPLVPLDGLVSWSPLLEGLRCTRDIYSATVPTVETAGERGLVTRPISFGQPRRLLGIRPIYRYLSLNAGFGAVTPSTSVYGVQSQPAAEGEPPEVAVASSLDPITRTWELTDPAANIFPAATSAVDSTGWIRAGLPLDGDNFVFRVTVPPFSTAEATSDFLADLVGLELEFEAPVRSSR